MFDLTPIFKTHTFSYVLIVAILSTASLGVTAQPLPQIEREFPKHFRIATTMMKGFQLPSELAEQSGATLAEVNDFIAASLVSGYAEAEQSAASDASPTTQKSLLDRLRGTR